MKKLYYLLTAHMPRKLPTNLESYQNLMGVLVAYYDVPNEPKAMATIASYICSVPAKKLRASYASLVNPAKRLEINHLANEQKNIALVKLKDKLEKAMQEATDSLKQDLLDHAEEAKKDEP